MRDLKSNIINTASDCASSLLYYDRKEDENLPVGAIELAIKDGVITVKEILDIFEKELSK